MSRGCLRKRCSTWFSAARKSGRSRKAASRSTTGCITGLACIGRPGDKAEVLMPLRKDRGFAWISVPGQAPEQIKLAPTFACGDRAGARCQAGFEAASGQVVRNSCAFCAASTAPTSGPAPCILCATPAPPTRRPGSGPGWRSPALQAARPANQRVLADSRRTLLRRDPVKAHSTRPLHQRRQLGDRHPRRPSAAHHQAEALHPDQNGRGYPHPRTANR